VKIGPLVPPELEDRLEAMLAEPYPKDPEITR
jgi:hypothetical protein